MNSVLITGSGSERNSWVPIKRALQKHYSYIPEDDLNFPFVNLIYQLRWLTEYSSFLKHIENPCKAIQIQEEFANHLSFYKALKESICEELLSSIRNEEIVLNDYIDTIVTQYLIGRFAILTTNWDNLLENRFGNYIHHIHGSTDDPESLYLPSEVIEEPYRDRVSHGKKAGISMKVLEDADRLLVYGLSFNTLDIELSLIISEAFHDRPGPSEVIIFDKDPRIVEQRLRFILRTKNCKFTQIATI